MLAREGILLSIFSVPIGQSARPARTTGHYARFRQTSLKSPITGYCEFAQDFVSDPHFMNIEAVYSQAPEWQADPRNLGVGEVIYTARRSVLSRGLLVLLEVLLTCLLKPH